MLLHQCLFLLILSKLSDVVKNDVVKKDLYNAKIKNIDDKIPDTTNVTTNSLNTKKNQVKGEILSITNLVTTAALNAKVNEAKVKIPNITNVATTTAALTAVENKIPNVSTVVKKNDSYTKISETEKKITDHDHDKYIITPEFNKLRAENFAARLAQANLGSKHDITTLVKTILVMKFKKKNSYLKSIKRFAS